jgi:hypothetical protein
MSCSSDGMPKDTISFVHISGSLSCCSLLERRRACKLVRVAEHHELFVSGLERCLVNGETRCQIKRLKIVGHVTSQTFLE